MEEAWKIMLLLHHPVLLKLSVQKLANFSIWNKTVSCTSNISTMLLYDAEWNRQLPAACYAQMTYCEMYQMYSTCMMINDGQQAQLFLQTICKWTTDVTVVISQFIPPIFGVTVLSVGIGVIWIRYTATSKSCSLHITGPNIVIEWRKMGSIICIFHLSASALGRWHLKQPITHYPLSSANVKNTWSYNFLPPACLNDMGSEKFTFFLPLHILIYIYIYTHMYRVSSPCLSDKCRSDGLVSFY
jgi:hypothetical protein